MAADFMRWLLLHTFALGIGIVFTFFVISLIPGTTPALATRVLFGAMLLFLLLFMEMSMALAAVEGEFDERLGKYARPLWVFVGVIVLAGASVTEYGELKKLGSASHPSAFPDAKEVGSCLHDVDQGTAASWPVEGVRQNAAMASSPASVPSK